jgi:hypothetical protein
MTSNNILKYFIHTAATIVVAAVVFAACNKDDNNASGTVPAKAVVTGEARNECPATSVLLTASADGAQSYLWYRNALVIANATASTYAAISSGTYYAVGVNAAGQGEKSEDKEVNVYLNCPPSVPTLTGLTGNQCPAMTVRLTATAGNVESYVWYKGTDEISGVTGAFYDVTESGSYSVAARNTYGTSERSAERTVTITQCPPAAPVISGDNLNVCPATTVLLTATAAGAESYQWYRYAEAIPGATASTYLVTTTGGYYVTATNGAGASEKNANAHVVYIDLCAANYTYADLLGAYHAGGTPSLFSEAERGPSLWASTITQPDDQGTYTYVITPFADFRTGDESPLLPVYLEVGQSTDNSAIAFAVDAYRALGTETVTDGGTGMPKTYTAYFDAFFTGGGYIYWFNTQYYQAFWDAETKTLDFSGVYTHEGVDYDIMVAVLARTTDPATEKKWEGAFTDGYKNCKFVQQGASGAPGAFTGERVALPKINGRTTATPSLTPVTINFDPAKFSRKR